MPEFAPGDVFVDHRIEGLAGRGGMGVVYRATQLGLDRLVALKIITPALAEDPSFRKRFVAESKAAASIEHPNVIPVYYAGEREGVLYIVMRYVDGPDLRALVRAQGKLAGERAAHILAQVGAGLDAAHQHGLVHRDVKPANVLLGPEDHAYLTDFGLTKRTASTDGGLSRTGGWVGTLGYVAPEQIRGERIDARTDVYALGCVFVYMLTGLAPYMRDSDEATLWAHLNSPPPSEAVPPQFEGVIARALAKDPSDRYPSAGDLGRAALAAAGRSAVPGPERNVARGAAAPAGVPSQTSSATVFAAGTPGGPADDGETRPSPPADGELQTVATGRDGGGGPPGRRFAAGSIRAKRALAGTGAALLAAGVAVFLLTAGDGDTPKTTAKTTTATTPRPPQKPTATAEKPVVVGRRPNSLTIARGRVWVLIGKTGEVQTLRSSTGERESIAGIDKDGKSITAGLRFIWAVKGAKTRSLFQLSERSGKKFARRQIDTPGEPVIVTTGENAVWVAVRRLGNTPGPETVVRISPDTLGQEAIDIPYGVRYIAVGLGALWVSHRFRNSVLRIKVGSRERKEIFVNGPPQGIAVGEKGVWVATQGSGSGSPTITRIDPGSARPKRIPVDFSPTQVAVGGGSVWATARDANRLIRIDPGRRTVVDNIETGRRPFALEVSKANSVWLTLLGDNAIQRVRFTR